MRSLDTALTSVPKPRGEYSDLTTISSGPVAPFDAAAVQRLDDLRKREKEIYEIGRHDPKQALKLAEALPEGPERHASTLSSVGEIIGRRDSSVAKAAMKDATHSAENTGPVFKLGILKDAADLYIDLKDQEAAAATISDCMKVGEELYKKDSDPSDPNLALKVQWHSTNVWRQFVGLAARISPEAALNLIEDVPDPEIHAFLRVALACSLLGQEPAEILSLTRTREGDFTDVWH